MRRKSGRKKRQNAARRGSPRGSIIALPFVGLVSIIKLPFVVLGFLAGAIGSVVKALIKFAPAAIGAVLGAIAAVFALLLRIPFGAIGKMLLWSVALVWRIGATSLTMLVAVLSNPRALALSLLILVVVLAAAYPESGLGSALFAVIFIAGAFWTIRQLGSSRVARHPGLGRSNIRRPRELNKRDLEEIYALTPREFEEFVRDTLTDLGYTNLSVVGGAGDLGVDIFGYDADGRSVAVQCKRYAPDQRIGSPTIMTFMAMQRLHHEAEIGIFVTTADFTRDARALAAHHDIWLINGVELVRLVRGGARTIGW